MSRQLTSRLVLLAAALTLAGCGAVVKSGPLSGRPDPARGIYLSTGGATRPFRTLGFVQIRGYGVNIAGLADVGDAALDGTVRGRLVEEAARMKGDAVINIEFIDENPPTTYERVQAVTSSAQRTFETGQPQIETKDRWVTVTGEIIQYVDR